MVEVILALNAGSSSLKFAIFGLVDPGDPALIAKGQIEGIGKRPHLVARDANGQPVADEHLSAGKVPDHGQAMVDLTAWLRTRYAGMQLRAIGHRVAHGGPGLAAPMLIDGELVEWLASYIPLAPLHQPHNLAAINAGRQRLPDLPQVACFDTAFHRGHSEVVDRFALPDSFYREGIRRYGFHGLSYEYIARVLPSVAPSIASGRVVVAHLGSGASMCAIQNGRSVDSTMSFTALDGLPMGTRCGALDPGVLLYLIGQKGFDASRLERLLYRESGLLGLSGESNDARDLLVSSSPMATLALDYFVHCVCRELGALSATLQGLDGIVFTAGIGENSAVIRARICEQASWLGLRLDEEANLASGPQITTPDSDVSVWVIPTDEEKMIALHTLATLRERATAAHNPARITAD
ncbi:MAG TPA: acetate/propionate family kinase [Hyphomicrobiaceae bacterium]